MIVCIAEKPSVAKDIAKIIGAVHYHNGYIEGNGYQVTWTYGHLCELKYPEDYTQQWKTWSLSSLPIIPHPFGIRLKKNTGLQKQFKIIQNLIEKADQIINCGDAGQEGELIQRWVMQAAGAKCPVSRLWISSLTEESIQQGFNNLKDQSHYQSLYEAGLCRAIGDWILGINTSRLYTLKYGGLRPGATPLSVGRVQTPTLAMIVKRCKEIDKFIPQTYWVVATNYKGILFSSTAEKYNTEKEAQMLLQRIQGKEFIVTNTSKKKGIEHAPHLFDLTSLQVECNRKFAFSADTTLKTIQSLYEKKLTTYPRVDTTYLSEDIYPKCKPILSNLSHYTALVMPLMGKDLPKSKRYFDSSKVTDHHAIIPTGVQAFGLTDTEEKVYNLVVRRFISIFYPDCIYTTTTITGAIENDTFKVTGKQIEEEGWHEVFAATEKVKEKKDSNEQSLPNFIKGERGNHFPLLSQKQTTPPKPYTEASLLRAMETAGKDIEDETLREALKVNGLGRPSTRAAIIETLFQRNYIKRERKNILSTSIGENLIDIIQEDLLKSAELTGHWEKKLRDIENNKYSAELFIDDMKKMVQDIVLRVLADNKDRRIRFSHKMEVSNKTQRKKLLIESK